VDQQQLEQIIRAITEEILGYLGTENSVDLCGLEIDSLICPGCDQRCAERCARKTRKVVEAGAARISAGAEVGPGVEGRFHILLRGMHGAGGGIEAQADVAGR